jgi:hypothetical protein
MIDQETAKSLVERYLSTLPTKSGSGWIVLDHRTVELDIAWLFFWTLERLAQPGARGNGMAGNCPLLVDKRDGSLYSWSMLEPIEGLLKASAGQRLSSST